MSGILKAGPAMEPFRFMYITESFISWVRWFVWPDAVLATLVVENHAEQTSYDPMPSGPTCEEVRQRILGPRGTERPCLWKLGLSAGRVDDLSCHAGVFDGGCQAKPSRGREGITQSFLCKIKD